MTVTDSDVCRQTCTRACRYMTSLDSDSESEGRGTRTPPESARAACGVVKWRHMTTLSASAGARKGAHAGRGL